MNTNTTIRQITPGTAAFPADIHGKWYCSAHGDGSDGHTVHRYLQADGSWGNTTHYFDTQEAVTEAALVGTLRGEVPDFWLSNQELQDRADIRDMCDEGFRDDYHDW